MGEEAGAAGRQALPQDFEAQMTAQLGADEAGRLFAALSAAAPVSVRLNARKGGAELAAAGGEAVPWCGMGRYLAERPVFTLDPLFHAGAYYVQEAASMFVEQAFRVMDGVPQRVLDLCAAPGGKSTLWRSLLPDGTLLVANEPVRQRAMVLAENMAKWGHPDVFVTNAYPADFAPLTGFFDVVAADVPCSGEGMFRKDSGAVAEWSAAAVALCAERQRGIITDVWPALREGGYLVYSTCTFNRQEDEDNVAWICRELGAEAVEVACPAAWGVTGDVTGQGLPVAHFFPHKTRGEGFFLALLRKTVPCDLAVKKKKKKTRGTPPPVPGAKTLAGWLRDSGSFKLLRTENARVSAARAALMADYEAVSAAARVIMAGVPLAEEKGRKLVPAAELALSLQLADGAFPKAELPLADALAYLRHEAVALPPSVPRGHVLCCFQGRPRGFANNLGSRANNLYPQEWRIRRL